MPEVRYLAIVEDAGPDTAVGVWFPDLPGCFSAGDDAGEALRNAEKALSLYADALVARGASMPEPRAVLALREDPAVQADLQEHVVALIALRSHDAHPAE